MLFAAPANILTIGSIFFSRSRSIQTGGVPLENAPSYESIDASYQALRNVITNPEFQKVLAEIQSLPPFERLQTAYAQLTTQALAVRGIPIPAQFSITTSTSEQSTSSAASTEDITATGQGTPTKPALQADTVVCVGVPPFRICWHTGLISGPSNPGS